MNFPTIDQISPNIREVAVYFDHEYQYSITNEIQLNNLRLWAIYTKQTQLIRFVWNGGDIFITEAGDLTDWPIGMFDGCSHQLVNMIHLKRGEAIEGELFVK